MCDKPLFTATVGKKRILECSTFDEAGDTLEAKGYRMAEGVSYGLLNYLEIPHDKPTRKVAELRRKCLD